MKKNYIQPSSSEVNVLVETSLLACSGSGCNVDSSDTADSGYGDGGQLSNRGGGTSRIWQNAE